MKKTTLATVSLDTDTSMLRFYDLKCLYAFNE